MKQSLHTVLAPRYHVYLVTSWAIKHDKTFDSLSEAKVYVLDLKLKLGIKYFITKEICL